MSSARRVPDEEEGDVTRGWWPISEMIRVRQRRAYGLRDEEYLRVKILTCMLPAI